MTTAAAGRAIPQGRAGVRGEDRPRRRPQPARGGPGAALRRLRRRGMSYEASLVLSLSLLVVSTGLAVSLLAFRGAREGTAGLAQSLFQEVSDHAVTKTRTFLERAGPIAQAMGGLADLGLATEDRDKLARQLLVVLRANAGLSWVSYGNEAGDFVGAYRPRPGELRINQSQIGPDGRTAVVEYEVMPDGSWQHFRSEPDSGFDPRVRPYYVQAKAAGRLVWTPPYVFYDQGVPGVTCANPLYDAAGKLRGVLTVDFDLATLSQFVEQQSASANSKLFIMAPDGTLLAHPAHRSLAEAAERAAAKARARSRGKGELLKVGELDDPLLAAFDAQLTDEDRAPATGGAGRGRKFEFRHGGTAFYARATAFTIDGHLTWIVGAVAPASDFLAAARRTSALSAAASLGAMLVAVAVAMVLARRVSGPVLSLVSFMDGVVRAGDLTAHRPQLGGAREFRQLSDALDRMLHDLRDRTRLRGDMAVAMQVQQGLLPARSPQVEGLDVHGFSVYCDETGGDYFDYIVLDRDGTATPTPSAAADPACDAGRGPGVTPELPAAARDNGGGSGTTHEPVRAGVDADRRGPGDARSGAGAAPPGTGLLVAIGDVVGHGIGSALVMAGARGVLHSRASACGHLGELMTHLNEQLVPDLSGTRFITMLLWYVDARRGTVCWANAGHDPALVYDPATDQFCESGRGGIPLGIEAGVPYEEQSFGPVRPGQVIVLGTDGVWETMNNAGELFGRERLQHVIRAAAVGAQEDAAGIAAHVRRELDMFRGAGHQRDDVTLVVIRVLPRGAATRS